MSLKPNRFFAFDFAGTISRYDGNFVSEEKVVEDSPNPEVVEVIRRLKGLGHKIIIHSTLPSRLLEKYCKKHDIPADYFNENPEIVGGNPGKPVAFAYIDDRAVCYRGQTAKELLEELVNFEPYYKKSNG